MVNKNINKIKLGIMEKILPNRLKKRRNTPKRVSNRTIKSLENNFSVTTTKNISSTSEMTIDKPQIVTKPEIAIMPKIVNQKKLLNHK